jgi:large subunit ribosomal protein L35
MPKMKPHKGVAKRVKVTSRGKVVHKRCGSGHLMSAMSPKRRRRARRPGILGKTQADALRRALLY